MSMNNKSNFPKSPREYYDNVYDTNLPVDHEWVAGSATPELIKLIWNDVIKPGQKVLEIGSGVGTESVFMAVRGMDVTGIDFSAAAVELGEKLALFYGVAEKAKFQQMDALQMSFADAEYDVVCDHGVFHHMADNERDLFAQQVARVLKPGGLLVLRCFSDKMDYNRPQPRLVSSTDLTDTFTPYFALEHMERVLSFSTPSRKQPLGWYTLWFKK